MCPSCLPPTNRVMEALPADVRRRWQPFLERVELPSNFVLHDSGQVVKFVYFPTTAMISLIFVTREGESMEVALVGREGMVGVEVLLGGGSTPYSALVGTPGEALRVPAWVIREEMSRLGPAPKLMLRYALALTSQVAQTAVCNRHHSVYQRFCRWLLVHLDGIEGDEVVATHEQISQALGSRREGVTEAAHRLQRLGVIWYSRGRIRVLDREGLERQACECHEVVQSEFARLLPKPPSTMPALVVVRGTPREPSRQERGDAVGTGTDTGVGIRTAFAY